MTTPGATAHGGTRVKILLLEDSAADTELIQRGLRRAGIDFASRHVTTQNDFVRELRDFQPDVVLSDHNIPQFDGRAALRLVRQMAPHVPFILVTGSLSEETAVEYMKAGAADYVLKDRLARLGSAVLGALQDRRALDEKERAEEALRASEAHTRAILANIADGVLVLDQHGKHLDANPRACELTGYSREELLRLATADTYPPADRAAAASRLAQVAAGEPVSIEREMLRKDGSLIIIESEAKLLPDGRLLATIRDVTERRQLERQLLQAQKMEAVGRLAGGVAHDFNNVLTAIFGYADLLADGLPPDRAAHADLNEIRAAANRAAALTRQLLTFSRQQVLQPAVLNWNAVVTNLEKMLHPILGEDVALVTSLAADLGNVKADPGQMEQVILNLAVNARDAMPTGGKLTIETANAQLDEPYLQAHGPVTPGSYVMLAVSDTGTGMDQATKARLFEPFFTTKEPGRGTGLGLATVHGIVNQSGGHVWVYSEPGHGATFKVYLPRVEAPAEVPAATVTAGPPTGTETVLLAEDDEMLRPLARSLLSKLGYTVLEAKSAAAALEAARRHRGTIHLLVSDVVMPGGSGLQLARQLAEDRPGLRVLYVSGYTDEAVVRHGLLERGINYLQKPFTPAALARKVREVLDARPEASTLSAHDEAMGRGGATPEAMILARLPRPVPPRALVISLASLAAPVLGAVAFPEWLGEDQGIVIWMTALVPAFLLAYYRGLRGVAVALAAGMAALSVTQATVRALGVASPDWTVLLGVVVLYLGICIALGVVAELLHRERQAAERLALMDPLTGLPNRRHAEAMLDVELAAAARGQNLAVVLFDLDHFKRVNDQHGHDAGDAALRAFAKVLKHNTRRMNLSARFGGEEFITVLSDCDLENAVRFANRVRDDLRATRFFWGGVTTSAGVAAYEDGMGSYEVLLAAADRALYAAKQAGRDRVVAAEPRAAVPPGVSAVPAEAAVSAVPAVVLVIDDDPDVLPAVGKILRAGGYAVELTDDPDIVIQRLRNNSPRIDLLVTDIMMPRMNGLTLVDHLLQLRPDLRVVYLSGYVQRTTAWAGLPGAVTGFVGKPIEMDELLSTVREVLERVPAAGQIGAHGHSDR